MSQVFEQLQNLRYLQHMQCPGDLTFFWILLEYIKLKGFTDYLNWCDCRYLVFHGRYLQNPLLFLNPGMKSCCPVPPERYRRAELAHRAPALGKNAGPLL